MSEVDALQTALAAEHAAVYVVGLLGARTSRSAEPGLSATLEASYAAHRGSRDVLVRTLHDLGATPAATAPAYEVDGDLAPPATRTRRALAVEEDVAATYAFLVGSVTGDLRAWAVRQLEMAAVRELVLRGTPEMFPGGDEHADR